MASKYRKRPVVIEAMQFDGTDECAAAIAAWSNYMAGPCKPWKKDYGFMEVNTPEDVVTASTDDWIIKSTQGEFYPCRPDIFETTYEQVAGS